MKTKLDIPLALGGHTFISQLGNEPMPSADEQREIVRSCLDAGIRWFDTTYRPEREGLGRALEALGRREEAHVIAWSFFQDVGTGPEDKLDPAAPYEPRHIGELLEQLRTSWIDCLVIHRIDHADEAHHEAQIALALEWKAKGYVRSLGVWEPRADEEDRFRECNPYEIMIQPLNIRTAEAAAPSFAAGKRLGWKTFAVSPFIRGWELDAMVEKACAIEGGRDAEVRTRLADHLLRFALFHPDVDRVVTAMRRPEWIAANVASVNRGPLSPVERGWLDRIRSGA